MPIFISYSRANDVFATKLAMQLIKHRATVWVDQWELHVGDSLINKIQEAIQGASALLVILSKASVDSEWCKKELSAGLIRELEERRVVVLPVLMEDCSIPVFLKGKLYADFRTNFDVGLKAVLESIARVTSDSLARVETPQWHVDWSVDYGVRDGEQFCMLLTAVEQAVGQPYSVLTQIHIDANNAASERYFAMLGADLDWVERCRIIDHLCERAANVRLRLDDEKLKTAALTLDEHQSTASFEIYITSRRLGEDTGRDILLDIAGQLGALQAGQKQKQRKLTTEESAKMQEINARFASSEG